MWVSERARERERVRKYRTHDYVFIHNCSTCMHLYLPKQIVKRTKIKMMHKTFEYVNANVYVCVRSWTMCPFKFHLHITVCRCAGHIFEFFPCFNFGMQNGKNITATSLNSAHCEWGKKAEWLIDCQTEYKITMVQFSAYEMQMQFKEVHCWKSTHTYVVSRPEIYWASCISVHSICTCNTRQVMIINESVY